MDFIKRKPHFSLMFLLLLNVLLYIGLGCQSVENKIKEKLDKIAFCEKLGDEQSINTLLKLLKDKEEKVREQAACSLGARTVCWHPHHSDVTKIGKLNAPRVMEALLKSLKDKSPRVRLAAAYSLTVYRNPIMVEPLIEALKDTTKTEFSSGNPVGSYAAYTLGILNDRRAVNPLIEALKSEDKEIRWWANDALRSLGEEKRAREEIKKLTPFFLEELKSESPDIVERGLFTVGQFRINEAVSLVNKFVMNKESKIRFGAIHALLEIGDETSVPVLIEALKDNDPLVRRATADALGKIKNDSAIPALTQALKDPDTIVQCNSAKSLGWLKAKSALPDIINLFENDNDYVKQSVIVALRSFDEPEVFSILLKGVESKYQQTADESVRVLGEKYARNLGDPTNHKEIVPQVISRIRSMKKWNPYYEGAIQVLIAVEDNSATPIIYEEFTAYKTDNNVINRNGELLVKMAGFIAKMGDETQKKEAIEWLKKASNENPNPNNRKQALETLKEVGIFEE